MIARQSLINLIINLISAVFSLIIHYLAVRLYPPEDFGILSYANSFFQLFLFFSDLSISTSHLRIINKKNYDKNEVYSVFVKIKLILVPIIALIFFIISYFSIKSSNIENIELLTKVMIIIFLTMIIRSYQYIFNFTLLGMLKITKMQTTQIIGSIFIKYLFQLFIIYEKLSFINYIFAILIGDIVILLMGYYFIKTEHFTLVKANKEIYKEFLSISNYLAISRAINILILNLGPIIFIRFHPPELLGVYGLLNSSLMTLNTLPKSFLTLLLPNYSKKIEENRFEKLKQEIRLYERYMLILAGAIIIVSFTLGPFFIMFIFGDYYYINGINYFYLWIITIIFWAYFNPYNTFVIGLEKLKLYLLTQIITFISAFIGWYFLIPVLDIIGIQIGVWIGILISTIIVRVNLYKDYKIGGFKKKDSIILSLILVLTSISYLFFKSKVEYSDILYIIIGAILLLSIYFVVLFISKYFTLKDIRFVIDLFNPKKLVKHFANELKNDKEETRFPNNSLEINE